MGVCTTCSHFQLHSCPVGNRFRLKCVYDTEEKKEEANTMKNMNVTNLTNPKTTKIVHKKWKAIAKDYTNGLSVSELSDKYKMTSSGIAYILNKEGVRDIKSRNEYINKIDDIKDKVLEDIVKGMTYDEIMKKYQISLYTVKKIKRESSPIRRSIIDNLDENLIADVKAGMLAKDIKEKYNLSAYKVTQIRKELGVIVDHNRYAKPIVEEQPIQEVEETKPAIEQEDKKGFTFYLKGEGLKPTDKCYPAEKDGLLVWAIDIFTVEELVAIGEKANGTLVIDGNRLDILPMHVNTGTGGDAA